VHGENKALLEIAGAPLLTHVISALQRSPRVARIFVVGPYERITAALDRQSGRVAGPKQVIVVEQRETLIENAWQGFLATLPSQGRNGNLLSEQDLERCYGEKAVLYLGADSPLLTADEVDEFIAGWAPERFDYILGTTPEWALEPYYPKPGRPGIRLAYFCFRESRERQNNLHLIRVFRVINLGIIQKMYQYRHQRRALNIARMLWALLRTKDVTFSMLVKFLLLHVCRLLDGRVVRLLQRFLARFLVKERIEQDLSRVLKIRFRCVTTTYGGAALDVDNEEHFEIIQSRFQEWMEFQEGLSSHRRAQSSASAPTARASGGA